MSKESASEKSSKSGAARRESPVHLVLRVIAIGLGLPLFALAIAAWLALWIENAWVALAVATAVVVLPTLLLVDRLLPADDPRKGRGIPTDLLSMVWLGGAVLCFGPLAFLLHSPLATFSDRVDGSGTARAIFAFVTGTGVEPAAPEVSVDSVPDSPDAGAPDAGATPALDITTDQDAGISEDANDDAGSDTGAPNESDASTASAGALTSPADIFQAYAAGASRIAT